MTYKQQLQWEEENNQVADNISFLQDMVESFTDSPRVYIRHSIEIKLAKRIFWEHLNGPADIRVIISLKAIENFVSKYGDSIDVRLLIEMVGHDNTQIDFIDFAYSTWFTPMPNAFFQPS